MRVLRVVKLEPSNVSQSPTMIHLSKRNNLITLFGLQWCLLGSIFIIVSLFSGCAELVIKAHDDGTAIIGKVVYRTVFAIGTLGYSEFKMAEVTQEYEREQKLRAYEGRVMEFLNRGEITQAEAEQLILKEKARLWSEEELKTEEGQTR